MVNFSTEDLMQYLYQETSKDHTEAIEKALQTDWILMDKLNVLKDTLQKLDETLDSPRPQAVSAILRYANATAVAEHP
jgi:hypothetical protein